MLSSHRFLQGFWICNQNDKFPILKIWHWVRFYSKPELRIWGGFWKSRFYHTATEKKATLCRFEPTLPYCFRYFIFTHWKSSNWQRHRDTYEITRQRNVLSVRPLKDWPDRSGYNKNSGLFTPFWTTQYHFQSCFWPTSHGFYKPGSILLPYQSYLAVLLTELTFCLSLTGLFCMLFQKGFLFKMINHIWWR